VINTNVITPIKKIIAFGLQRKSTLKSPSLSIQPKKVLRFSQENEIFTERTPYQKVGKRIINLLSSRQKQMKSNYSSSSDDDDYENYL
jgi:hypothetical protein